MRLPKRVRTALSQEVIFRVLKRIKGHTLNDLDTDLLIFHLSGTGKTLMARQIGKMLNTREPKIISGPGINSCSVSVILVNHG